MFLKNKHVVIAMLIAPILSIIAWYGVDKIVVEEPTAPKTGETYRLAEKPNCRWESNTCTLINNNFELNMTVKWQDGGKALVNMTSSFPLEGAQIALFISPDEEHATPVVMQTADYSMTRWSALLNWAATPDSRLRLVAKHNGIDYYGDVATTFTVRQTPISHRHDGD